MCSYFYIEGEAIWFRMCEKPGNCDPKKLEYEDSCENKMVPYALYD